MNPDVFHITHLNNLASIIQSGGLISDAIRINQKIGNQNIGYSHIKQRRCREGQNEIVPNSMQRKTEFQVVCHVF
jgi:hypothetical protein